MFRRPARALVRSMVIALALTVSLASVVLAWNSTCSAGEACVWKNGPFVLPLAAQATGDRNYADDAYPNNIDSIDNSVSSIKNRFGSNDVVWYFDPVYSGASFCLNAGWESGQLNSHNDQYSSHLIAISSTC